MSGDAFAAFAAERGIRVEDIQKAIDLSGDEVVFAAGSIVDGLGDSDSDVDLFILTSTEDFERRRVRFDSERAAQQRRLDFGIFYLDLNGTEFDVEVHRREKYLSLFTALSDLKPIGRASLWSNFRSLGAFDRTDAVELLHRFLISWPVAQPSNYENLRRSFDVDTYFAWNACFHLMECEDFAKGIRRSLRENDVESAYLKLCNYYNSLADAFLFLQGESLDRWKWRLPKLRRVNDDSFLQQYLTVHLYRGNDDIRSFVEDLLQTGLEVHGRLALEVQL